MLINSVRDPSVKLSFKDSQIQTPTRDQKDYNTARENKNDVVDS